MREMRERAAVESVGLRGERRLDAEARDSARSSTRARSGWAGASRAVGVIGALGILVLATGCLEDIYPFCYGVNETNLPSTLVIVEGAEEADRYRVAADDWRLQAGVAAGLVSIQDGRLVSALPSCRALDDFASVQALTFGETRRFSDMSTRGEANCKSLSFEAESVPAGLTLIRKSRAYDHWTAPDPYVAAAIFGEAPSRLVEARATGGVSLSPLIDATSPRSAWNKPLADDALYRTDGDHAAPPIIIARHWVIEDTPEAAEVLAYLGVTPEDGQAVECVDYYFGYFEGVKAE